MKQLSLSYFVQHNGSVTEPDKSLYSSKLFQKLKPTNIINTYWKFAAERQNVFFKRFYDSRFPWTEDLIIQKHKFTNSYRASDRVSQYLIKNVQYLGDQTESEIFFRTILFKIFNKIETWELLLKKLGHISYKEYSFKLYDEILTSAQVEGKKIYSAAYIMPSGGRFSSHKKKHRMHLELIEFMMRKELPQKICSCNSMKDVYIIFKSCPTIGNFLAYQYAIDINYSLLTDFDENNFVMAGPGAHSGILKCFDNPHGYSDEDIIKMVTDVQSDEFKRLNINFQNLWGRDLKLIDCQNLFCETDKYARVAHPELSTGSNRTRIKQKFAPTANKIDYFFPPKWNINDKILHGKY